MICRGCQQNEVQMDYSLTQEKSILELSICIFCQVWNKTSVLRTGLDMPQTVLAFPNALHSAGLYGKRDAWKEKSFPPKLYLCSLLRRKLSLPPPYFSTVGWTWPPHHWKFSGFDSQLKEVFGTYNYLQLKIFSSITQPYLPSCSLRECG